MFLACTPGGWISEPSTVSIYEGRTTSEVGDVLGEIHQAWGDGTTWDFDHSLAVLLSSSL